MTAPDTVTINDIIRRYMTRFSDEYLAAVPPAARPAVEWLGPFVRDHIDLAAWENRVGQFVCQGVRLQPTKAARL